MTCKDGKWEDVGNSDHELSEMKCKISVYTYREFRDDSNCGPQENGGTVSVRILYNFMSKIENL
jgi:hypothetical protein